VFVEKSLTLHSMLHLDAPYLREPTGSSDETLVVGCCCHRRMGLVNAQMTIAEMGLLPGAIGQHKNTPSIYL
jgi:hypothetical protein